MKSIVVMVVALVVTAGIAFAVVNHLTEQNIAAQMKKYEDRWKADDERIRKMEAEVAALEKLRDEMKAEAAEHMKAAAAASNEGVKNEEKILARPLTAEEQSKKNGTQVVEPIRLDTANPAPGKEAGKGGGLGKGRIKWGEETKAAVVEGAK